MEVLHVHGLTCFFSFLFLFGGLGSLLKNILALLQTFVVVKFVYIDKGKLFRLLVEVISMPIIWLAGSYWYLNVVAFI